MTLCGRHITVLTCTVSVTEVLEIACHSTYILISVLAQNLGLYNKNRKMHLNKYLLKYFKILHNTSQARSTHSRLSAAAPQKTMRQNQIFSEFSKIMEISSNYFMHFSRIFVSFCRRTGSFYLMGSLLV